MACAFWKWPRAAEKCSAAWSKPIPTGRTYGLDLSPNMAAHTLRVARKACPQAEAHCGAVDVRNLPFRSASFDAVMCCYLLELLSQDDIRLTLREIRRVLRPGGNFSLVVIGQNVKMFNGLYTVCGSLGAGLLGPPGGKQRTRADPRSRDAGGHRPVRAPGILPLARAGGGERRRTEQVPARQVWTQSSRAQRALANKTNTSATDRRSCRATASNAGWCAG